MAVYARLTRSSMLEVADQDSITTARAKGVPEGRILRDALLPIITFAGIQAGQFIAGSILVNTVGARPGIGRLAPDDHVLLVVLNLITNLSLSCRRSRMEVQ